MRVMDRRRCRREEINISFSKKDTLVFGNNVSFMI